VAQYAPHRRSFEEQSCSPFSCCTTQFPLAFGLQSNSAKIMLCAAIARELPFSGDARDSDIREFSRGIRGLCGGGGDLQFGRDMRVRGLR